MLDHDGTRDLLMLTAILNCIAIPTYLKIIYFNNDHTVSQSQETLSKFGWFVLKKGQQKLIGFVWNVRRDRKSIYLNKPEFPWVVSILTAISFLISFRWSICGMWPNFLSLYLYIQPSPWQSCDLSLCQTVNHSPGHNENMVPSGSWMHHTSLHSHKVPCWGKSYLTLVWFSIHHIIITASFERPSRPTSTTL